MSKMVEARSRRWDHRKRWFRIREMRNPYFWKFREKKPSVLYYFGINRTKGILPRVLSRKTQSALGYMAPEFACQTMKITEKCDVYGFGVLIHEVVTGKRPVEYMEDDVVLLCEFVRGALDEGRVEECIDHNLQGNYPIEEAIPLIKAWFNMCISSAINRPDMVEVIRILELIQCPSECREELE